MQAVFTRQRFSLPDVGQMLNRQNRGLWHPKRLGGWVIVQQNVHLEYPEIILKKVFQPMIESQSDFNRIVFDDVEVRRNKNQILWKSRTDYFILHRWIRYMVADNFNLGLGRSCSRCVMPGRHLLSFDRESRVNWSVILYQNSSCVDIAHQGLVGLTSLVRGSQGSLKHIQ